MPNIRSEDSGQIIVRLPERTRRALNIIVRHKNEKNPGAKFSANSVIRHVIESHIDKYMKENRDVIDMILEDIRGRIKRGEFKGVSKNNLCSVLRTRRYLLRQNRLLQQIRVLRPSGRGSKQADKSFGRSGRPSGNA